MKLRRRRGKGYEDTRLGIIEEKEGKSGMDRDKGKRKVTFKEVRDKEGIRVKGRLDTMKVEIVRELERMKEEWRRKTEEMEERMRIIESDTGGKKK